MNPHTGRPRQGFTIIELLVAVTVLALILVLTLQITANTSSLLRRTRSTIDAFQESRAAFETLTRKISQADLKTFWDYDNATTPTKYVRQSELHFISGPAESLLSGVKTNTQAIFFQAPLGYSSVSSADKLTGLLNACGYFVEFANDTNERPSFLRNSSLLPDRYRFRLMEFLQPTEQLSVYEDAKTTGTAKNWFVTPLQSANAPKRMLAQNIIALVILPKRSPNDPVSNGAPSELAPNYLYDSRIWQANTGALADLTRNQLPPIVTVTMVAIDEDSAGRLQDKNGSSMPTFASGLFSTAANYTADLASLEKKLVAENINYRIFSTDISIPQAKWSEN